jgi:hypothetical protein
MRLTEDQRLLKVTETRFPEEAYPVLYKAYSDDYLSDKYKLENNQDGIGSLQPLIEVYREYYNLQLDTTTLSQITYNNIRTPHQLVFIVRFKGNDGKELYLWELYQNWMDIKKLNTTKWIN